MKLHKVKKILQELPWLKRHFADGGVFATSRIPPIKYPERWSHADKQFANYLRKQLHRIVFRPITSLRWQDTIGHQYTEESSFPSSNRPYVQHQYAIYYHYHEDSHEFLGQFMPVDMLGEGDTVESLLLKIKQREGIPDFIVKIIKSFHPQHGIKDAFEIFRVPEWFLTETQGDDEDDEEDLDWG